MAEQWALLFDLDDTLVLTSSIKSLRDSRKWSEVHRSFGKTSLPPGTSKFIEGWSKAASLGVITTSPRTYAESLLRHHNLAVPVLTAYYDTSRHKPHPDPILHALRKIPTTHDRGIYIGDLPDDLQAANAAGVTFILVAWNGFAFQPGSSGVAPCHSWSEVSQEIERIIASR